MIKRNIPFEIEVATTVQNLTNESKGNLEKVFLGYICITIEAMRSTH